MSGKPQERALVLGVHPTARGFGWVTFENPFSVFQHGVYTPFGRKNPACIRKLEWLLDRFQPEALALEAFDKESSLRSPRIRRLCEALVALASERGIEVAVFKRGEVLRTFSLVGARTRHEIAQAVARHVPSLARYLPSPRKVWVGEDKRLSVFSAAAVVLTFYQNGATTFLNHLKDVA